MVNLISFVHARLRISIVRLITSITQVKRYIEINKKINFDTEIDKRDKQCFIFFLTVIFLAIQQHAQREINKKLKLLLDLHALVKNLKSKNPNTFHSIRNKKNL